MGITDEQLYRLLSRDLTAARAVLNELYYRGKDISDVLNPVREAQAALRDMVDREESAYD